MGYSTIFAAQQSQVLVDQAPSSSESPRLYHWLLLGLLGLIWGSSYILIKRGLDVFVPEQLACLRIVISALAFLPFFIRRFHAIEWSKFKSLAVVGFTGSFFPAFLFALAQTEINSSTTGVLSSLTPLFTLLLGILFFRVPLVWVKVVGVIIGLSGAILLILFANESGMQGNMWYGLLVILASLFYAISSNTVKVHLQETNTITLSSAAFVIIGIPALGILLTTDFFQVMQQVDGAWVALGYVSILALFGTVLASILFFRLVQLTNAVFSSTVSYLIPMVAVGWGMLDGEFIGLHHLAGMLLILAGVYISGKK